MATSSTFTTPLFAYNRTTTTTVRFPSKIIAAYTTSINRTSSSSYTSHYEILGIQTSATYQEIKQAYRKLARVSRPDVVAASSSSSGSGADEFIKIHSAYSTLSDPAKRADYDRMMMRGDVRPTYGYARADDTTAFSHRKWETDQCW